MSPKKQPAPVSVNVDRSASDARKYVAAVSQTMSSIWLEKPMSAGVSRKLFVIVSGLWSR